MQTTHRFSCPSHINSQPIKGYFVSFRLLETFQKARMDIKMIHFREMVKSKITNDVIIKFFSWCFGGLGWRFSWVKVLLGEGSESKRFGQQQNDWEHHLPFRRKAFQDIAVPSWFLGSSGVVVLVSWGLSLVVVPIGAFMEFKFKFKLFWSDCREK